jgi:predicted methyltransferase
MHRMKKFTPAGDAADKLRVLGRGLRGRVLDTCTGLGYTAIGASGSEAVDEVVTIELDVLMLHMQQANPWSAPLLSSSKISRYHGNTAELLATAPDDYFDSVCHDPPGLGMAGELYSLDFYRELHRVMREGGSLYHYIGDPDTRTSGRHFRGVVERLQIAGFKPRVVPKSCGVYAVAQSTE